MTRLTAHLANRLTTLAAIAIGHAGLLLGVAVAAALFYAYAQLGGWMGAALGGVW